jgi:beta-glucanase (GH16 family)
MSSIGRYLACTALAVAALSCGPPADEDSYENPNGPVVWTPGTWSIVWQDEFEGPAGTPPDPTRWNHELGGWGWGNKELQYYTDSPENAAMDGAGNLIITARAEMVETNPYTSARLTTKGIFSRAYGRFEARMRLADGRGLWPAFWIMGDDIDEVGWPSCGEMDIVEQRGSALHTVSAALHGPLKVSEKRDEPISRDLTLQSNVAQDFHVYAVELPYFQITPARRPNYARWVWDHPFFIIVNLAVGGLFPGNPDETTMFPATIAIDYVRVSVRQDSDGGVSDGADGD